MEQNQLFEIKRIASLLEEHAIFSYSKRALLFFIELSGWLLFVAIIIAAYYLFNYNPQIKVPIDSQDYFILEAHIKEVNQILKLVALMLVIFDVPVLILTLFCRRFRRKKAIIYELISKIKVL